MSLAGINSILPGLNRFKPVKKPAGINQFKSPAGTNTISAAFFPTLVVTVSLPEDLPRIRRRRSGLSQLLPSPSAKLPMQSTGCRKKTGNQIQVA